MLINNIFYHLLKSTHYFSVVLPHLKPDYFQEKLHGKLFEVVRDYNNKYNKIPTPSDLKLLIQMDNNISEATTEDLYSYIDSLKNIERVEDEKLLIAETESYVKQRALELAALEYIRIVQDPKENNAKIEDIIKSALSIEFEIKLGHDYYEDAIERFKWYNEDENKIPVDIDVVNQAMGGGLVKKAMFIILSSTNTGKTVNLCHYASGLVKSGRNVLYISGEESEREILTKNDANLLDIDISNLNKNLDGKLFKSRFKELCAKAHGKFIVKEFPTGSASAKHIKNLLQELRSKKNFEPDVVVLDGLNNFASYKIPASQTGTPIYVKNVAEEQRALCSEFNYALLTNAQFNRGAKAKGVEAGLEDIGEAYAIAQTGDWASSLIQTDELREQGKYLIKNLKTRFGKNKGTVYTMGINYDKMRLLNLSEAEQEIPLHIRDRLLSERLKEDSKEESTLYETFDFS